MFFFLSFFRPTHLQDNFIIPNIPDNFDPTDTEILKATLVRIFSLFDFGWTTKGSGRSYDSLSGTGAMIGFFTKKVISYINLNRKCRSCDLKVPLEDHKCKKNFEGSAKAMEPHAAEQLATKNPVFTACNIEIGLIGADNDSCAIKAMRDASKHEIIKHSDRNHTTKGIVAELYRMKATHKELTNKNIDYLKKCYTYAVAQNKNNSVALSEALRSVPNHCFNFHDNCGTWCGYSKDPENYQHNTIGDGFQDVSLLDELQCLFDTLAEKSNELTHLISTNPNESLNNTLAAFTPKSRMYHLSESGSQRTASGILKKNEGQKYNITMNKKASLSPGKYTIKHAYNQDLIAANRYERDSSVEAINRRFYNKKNKVGLRHRKENSEGPTYVSDVGLLQINNPPAIAHCNENEPSIVVLFDLETGDFRMSADILQIAAKCGDREFSIYIKPTQAINPNSTNVNKLSLDADGNMRYKGETVKTYNLKDALVQFYQFLCSFNRKCVLTAHNCNFDRPRLIKAVKKISMLDQFKSIIEGFSDTLAVIKKVTGKKGKNEHKLENIAKNFKVQVDDAHNALSDVQILDTVLEKLEISSSVLLKSALTWENLELNEQAKADKKKEVAKKKEKITIKKKAIEELGNLASNNILKKGMINKLVAARISYGMLLEAFEDKKYLGIKNLLGKDAKDVVRVTENKKIIQAVTDYFKSIQKTNVTKEN